MIPVSEKIKAQWSNIRRLERQQKWFLGVWIMSVILTCASAFTTWDHNLLWKIAFFGLELPSLLALWIQMGYVAWKSHYLRGYVRGAMNTVDELTESAIHNNGTPTIPSL